MTTIITKNGSGAPTAGQLSEGELAVDLTNKELYTKSGSTVIKIGSQGGSTGTFTDLTATSSFTSPGIDDNANATAITLDANENVGIGTNDAQGFRLSARYNDNIMRLRGTGVGYLDITSDDTAGTIQLDSNNSDLTMAVNGDEKVRIDSTGNVGIGTDLPSGQLVVSNSGAQELLVSATLLSDGTYTSHYNRNTASYIDAVSRASSYDFRISNATSALTIDSAGRVGINETAPTEALHVRAVSPDILVNDTTEAYTDINAGIILTGSTNSAPRVDTQWRMANQGTDLTFSYAGSASPAMTIESTGSLLIGTTTQPNGSADGIKLNAGSSGRILSGSTTSGFNQVLFFNPNGQVGSISTSGNNTAYTESSDERLKENIVDAPAGNIDSLKVRSFDWKADGEHQEYGFIAQELEVVAPYAVTKGETDEDMWGVDYSKLVPMMIKEIQDLKAEVAALKGA